jgi:Na+/phosphate symporter
MNKRKVKKLFVEVLRSYKDSEQTVIYNMSGEPEKEIEELNKEIREYLIKMRKALNEGD